MDWLLCCGVPSFRDDGSVNSFFMDQVYQSESLDALWEAEEEEEGRSPLQSMIQILGPDTVYLIDGSRLRLSVHLSAKRVIKQMETMVQFLDLFPEHEVDVLGDFNAVLTQANPSSLNIHSKEIDERLHSSSNKIGTIDFHRHLSFARIPVDSTCKKRWDSTQGSKVGKQYSAKIDYIFRLAPKGSDRTYALSSRVLEHGNVVTEARPPAQFYPADHFEVETTISSSSSASTDDDQKSCRTEVLRSWNICGESLTSSSSNEEENFTSEKSTKSIRVTSDVALKLVIPPNCFEFLTVGANEQLIVDPEIMAARERIIDSMPSYRGISFRDRLNGFNSSFSSGNGNSSAVSSTANSPACSPHAGTSLKSQEFSTILRNCPPVNIHYAPFLSGDLTNADCTFGEQQMRLLGDLWQEADIAFRSTATPEQVAIYDLWQDFKSRCFTDPTLQTFLRSFYAEVVAETKLSFWDVLLPHLLARDFDLWALQEVSAPLQAQLEAHRDVFVEQGYQLCRVLLLAPAQKTWGVIILRRNNS